MPYYPKIKLLHLHIPKTGGTSIENTIQKALGEPIFDWKTSDLNYRASQNYKSNMENEATQRPDIKWQMYNLYGLSEIAGEKVALQHLTYNQMLRGAHLSRDLVDWVLVAVRNPYSRMISVYNWQTRYGFNGTFKQFVTEVYRKNLHEIGKRPIDHRCYQHLIPQHKYLEGLDVKKMEICVIKFENLAEEFEKFFSSKICAVHPNIPKVKLRKDNVTRGPENLKRQWINYYKENGELQQDIVDMVYKLYDKDFKMFGYSQDITSS